ncbi:hypothetical protein [Neobacillus vireti]|uniref:Uncharacterized protein n=1 Tax=Neobacillus vireti LMG 21834 TaxID=1131730 RepID=A0AB94IGV4_9BACI|nr:hypothetical protein [Neobacillus vireti]ETI66342.1 hypothetical protein BAVI_23203 [Neobacillus vireti LMG 21834]KLT16518.1 hypothetical protein AA980_18845 [Neobacillus vireti]
MKKILFFQENDRKKLLFEVNERLITKNRLLRLIISNPDKKTSVMLSRQKKIRYEEQIMLLEAIRNKVISCDSREQLREINNLIDSYNSLS